MATILTSSIVITLYLLVFGLAELLYQNGLSSSITRKIVHIGSGIISAVLPLLIELNTALFMGIVLFTLILISKQKHLLQSIHAIEDTSVGAVLFAPSIMITALLFWPVDVRIYQGACLILGLSDGMAGLIGKRYGRKIYGFPCPKTVEGSAIFFGITVSLLLAIVYAVNSTVAFHDIAYAFGGSLLLTATEALSRNGWDNLFVPIASGAILYFIV